MIAHAWGPHKDGIRWVQCQVCECLLHDPEAHGPCPGDPAPILERRARDAQRLRARLAALAKREAGEMPPAPSTAHGLWQTL